MVHCVARMPACIILPWYEKGNCRTACQMPQPSIDEFNVPQHSLEHVSNHQKPIHIAWTPPHTLIQAVSTHAVGCFSVCMFNCPGDKLRTDRQSPVYAHSSQVSHNAAPKDIKV